MMKNESILIDGRIEALTKKYTNSLGTLPIETKNQWARDDPAFIYITAVIIMITRLVQGLITSHMGFVDTIISIIKTILLNFAIIGLIIASLSW